MSHLGILCPELGGHLNAMMSLARALQSRGHRVTFYQLAHSRAKIEAGGFGCSVYGVRDLSPEKSASILSEFGRLSGGRAIRYTLEVLRLVARAGLEELPDRLRAEGVDALLVDQASGEGGTIAAAAGIPFITISNTVILNADPAVPPYFTNWSFRDTWWARARNRLMWAYQVRLCRPLLDEINSRRRQFRLDPLRCPNDGYSRLRQISQQPPEFEFPRRELPACVHFAGPLCDPAIRPPAPFPFERLDGRPLVYASLGTLANRHRQIFRVIAEACAPLPVQLVLSLGGGGNPEELGQLPGDPLVVGFAPQLEVLKRAALCITHAGMNTVLECLSAGVPMVAIPITNDEPGIAARLRWAGAGERVTPRRLTARRLRRAIEQVLAGDSYRQNAKRLQTAIARRGGPREAAEVIEATLAGCQSAFPAA